VDESMANPEHLKILMQGVEAWNKWREENTNILPDLREADISRKAFSDMFVRASTIGVRLPTGSEPIGANLDGVNFNNADLSRASLYESQLVDATFINANLTGANLRRVNLLDADFSNANLTGVDLTGSYLARTNFYKTDLSRAILREAIMIETSFKHANISDCQIYGVSAWSLNLTDSIQKNLIVSREPLYLTPDGRFLSVPHQTVPIITIDNLEIAQFVYLLLHNEKIRNVIDTIGKKAVLILGRFTPERKAVLDAIREELRRRDYIPILFDFEKPASRDLTETISTLAHLSRFIIADITDAKSIPQELQAIVPNLPSVAVQPIIHVAEQEYGMFEHFRRYPWVLTPYQYEDQDTLIKMLGGKVVEPAEEKVNELRAKR